MKVTVRFTFQGEELAAVRDMATVHHPADAVARSIARRVGHAVELLATGGGEGHSDYEARWFDGEVFRAESVAVFMAQPVAA